MRSFDLGTFRLAEQAFVKKWCCRLLVYGVALGLFALAAGVASSERSHRAGPPAHTGMANTHSGAGNLVPVF
jgi:hypothetical protein